MEKKRVEWTVDLYRYNLGENKGKLYPCVAMRRTIDLEGLINAVMEERSELRRETLRSAASQLIGKAQDLLIEGYTLSTPLGILTPTVSGMWNSNRLSPEARAENKALLNYTMSTELKNAFQDPLFKVGRTPVSSPHIYNIIDMTSGERNKTLTPGGFFRAGGQRLLMNGDLPERGLYLLDKETGRQAAFIPAADFVLNSRSEICARLPEDVPPGKYILQVVSQCTTSPRPMKAAVSGKWSGTVVVPGPDAAGH